MEKSEKSMENLGEGSREQFVKSSQRQHVRAGGKKVNKSSRKAKFSYTDRGSILMLHRNRRRNLFSPRSHFSWLGALGHPEHWFQGGRYKVNAENSKIVSRANNTPL